jgi:shikimate kinase
LNKTNIVFIGFSGAGKSTIGKKFAQRINYNFVDLDRYFEKKYRSSILNFFQTNGEEKFRRLEHELLKEVLQQSRCVVACGGGTPCFYNNMELINLHATSIYIELPPTSLHQRLLHFKENRPLIKELTSDELLQYINVTLEEREPFYKKANFTVNGEKIEISTLVKLITE